MPDASVRPVAAARVGVAMSAIRSAWACRATTRARTCRSRRTVCRALATAGRQRAIRKDWLGRLPEREVDGRRVLGTIVCMGPGVRRALGRVVHRARVARVVRRVPAAVIVVRAAVAAAVVGLRGAGSRPNY